MPSIEHSKDEIMSMAYAPSNTLGIASLSKKVKIRKRQGLHPNNQSSNSPPQNSSKTSYALKGYTNSGIMGMSNTLTQAMFSGGSESKSKQENSPKYTQSSTKKERQGFN